MKLPSNFVKKVQANRKNWQRTDEDYKQMQKMVNEDYRDMCRSGEIEFESFARGCDVLEHAMRKTTIDDLDFDDEIEFDMEDEE